MSAFLEMIARLDQVSGLVEQVREAASTPGFAEAHSELMDYTADLVERALTRLERDFAREKARVDEALRCRAEGE